MGSIGRGHHQKGFRQNNPDWYKKYTAGGISKGSAMPGGKGTQLDIPDRGRGRLQQAKLPEGGIVGNESVGDFSIPDHKNIMKICLLWKYVMKLRITKICKNMK